jgi:hypothetical protein
LPPQRDGHQGIRSGRIWLHKTALARIAANGGNVPKDLLD